MLLSAFTPCTGTLLFRRDKVDSLLKHVIHTIHDALLMTWQDTGNFIMHVTLSLGDYRPSSGIFLFTLLTI